MKNPFRQIFKCKLFVTGLYLKCEIPAKTLNKTYIFRKGMFLKKNVCFPNGLTKPFIDIKHTNILNIPIFNISHGKGL